MSEQKNTEWEINNLPNRLTIFRIILIPVIVVCLTIPFEGAQRMMGWVACWVFVIASITDFLDGYIARKRKIVTLFGSFLDPIADKFLVVSSLILLLGLGRIHPVIVIILVVREMYMTALRLLAMERGTNVPVNKLGKYKTAFQMVAIPMLMANDKLFGIPLGTLGTILIYIASFFSLYSALIYSISLVKKLQEEIRKKREHSN